MRISRSVESDGCVRYALQTMGSSTPKVVLGSATRKFESPVVPNVMNPGPTTTSGAAKVAGGVVTGGSEVGGAVGGSVGCTVGSNTEATGLALVVAIADGCSLPIAAPTGDGVGLTGGGALLRAWIKK
jgi:hypothetical protein